MGYKGQVELKSTEVKRQTITGSTSATHTLTWTPPNEQSLLITINGVGQHDSAYSVSGTTLTLASALVSSDELEITGIQDAGKTIIPAAGSVSDSHISSTAAIAASKLSSTLDLSSKTVTLPAASVTAHATDYDDNDLKNDIALLGFRVASNGSLAKYDLSDQIIEDYQDSSGIDSGASTSVLRQSGYASGGSSDSYLKLLMHFDEAANYATTITPTVGPGNFTAGNNARVDNGSAKFGTMSGRFQSSPNQYMGATSHADFDFGTGDFTVDFWCEFNGSGLAAGSSNSLFQLGDASASDYWSIQANAGTLLLFRIKDTGDTVYNVSASHTWVTTAGTWTHVAVTRDSGKVYLFINGTLLNAGGTTFAHDIKAAGTGNELRLATDSAGDWDTNFDGYIDEVRIRKGSASWTSSFTPETTAYGTTTTGADMTLVSTATTAQAQPTKGDIVMTYSNGAGTASLGDGTNGDIRAFVSRDNGTTYTQGPLASEGTTGGHTILSAHDIDISGQPAGTSMRYKITTHNQSAGSKETLIQAISLGWG